MMGSFLTRGLVMVFGYAYPAYECYKTVERNKPEIEQLRFWCQYWILVAMLTVFERVGDTFISWLPMYSEAKLAFYIYLWYPKTKGTTYVYDSFFRPYVAKHETEIDRNLLEIRTRAGDVAVQYWQKAATYGQTRVFEILQYVASQSTSRPPPPSQQQQQNAGALQPPSNVRTRQPVKPKQPLQPSRTSSAGAVKQEPQQDSVPPPPKPPVPAAATTSVADPESTLAATASTPEPSHGEVDTMQIDPVSSAGNENANPPEEQETIMEQAIRMTRGRLRRTQAATNQK